MSLQYKQGNIIDALKKGEINFLMHQVNCEGEMGAGIARSIAYHFPNTERDYLQSLAHFKKLGNTEFGRFGDTSDKIINVYSQYYKGPPSNRLFMFNGYETVDSFNNRLTALKCAVDYYAKLDAYGYSTNLKIGIPLIASGMAADRSKKEKFIKPFGNVNADLLYFKEYIAPIFEPYDNFICYYL